MQLGGVIRRICRGAPFCHGGVRRLKVAPSSVGDVSSVMGLPFAAGCSLESGCPFKLYTIPVDRVIHVRTSSKAANGPAIIKCAHGSLSS